MAPSSAHPQCPLLREWAAAGVPMSQNEECDITNNVARRRSPWTARRRCAIRLRCAARSDRFFRGLMLNSPDERPSRHWELDVEGIRAAGAGVRRPGHRRGRAARQGGRADQLDPGSGAGVAAGAREPVGGDAGPRQARKCCAGEAVLKKLRSTSFWPILDCSERHMITEGYQQVSAG